MSITDLFSHDDPSPLAGLGGEQTRVAPTGAPAETSEPERTP